MSLKLGLYYFFHLEKLDKQNVFLCKFKMKLKGPSIHCQEFVDQKY